jgi:hypothetical protein
VFSVLVGSDYFKVSGMDWLIRSKAWRWDALSELPVHRFALGDIVQAHEAVESGVTGKVLVDIG